MERQCNMLNYECVNQDNACSWIRIKEASEISSLVNMVDPLCKKVERGPIFGGPVTPSWCGVVGRVITVCLRQPINLRQVPQVPDNEGYVTFTGRGNIKLIDNLPESVPKWKSNWGVPDRWEEKLPELVFVPVEELEAHQRLVLIYL
ncbi:hypothetical protein ACLOJK_028438 [Asimina triloba]